MPGLLKQYVIALSTTSITIAILAAFIYLKGRKKIVYWTLALYSLSTAFWSGGEAYAISTTNKELALLWWRINHVGVIFIPVFFVHFVYSLLEIDSYKRKIIKGIYIVALIFLLLDSTRLLILEVAPKAPFNYFINPGIVYHLFFSLWISLAVYGLVELFKAYLKSTGARRNQLKYLCWGTLLGYIGGAPNFFPTFNNIQIPFLMPYGTYGIPIYVLVATYAIVKLRLMDINIALTRAGIFIIVYTLVLGIPLALTGWGRPWLQGLFGAGWYWMPAILAVILATAGPFIYLFLQHRAEKILRTAQLVYQKALRDTSATIMLNKDLDKLLKVIVLNVVDIVKVTWAGIYLKDEKEAKYTLRHCRSKREKLALPEEFGSDSTLIKHLNASKLPLIGEELHSQELKVGLAVPCFLDSRMIGFLLLGDKPKGQIYDQSDVNAFTLLSNQTALAIENCQFYSQEKQREHYRRIASLDRQIDCMAHEMDNPIHACLAVLGSIDIALDELKEIIPQEKMDYLKQKLSRVEFNAGRVSKMIASVKEFTKPATEELSPIPLQQIVDSFVAIINPQIHYYGINFTRELPQEDLWLRVNKVKIEQVLVNLGGNSVDAIREMPKGSPKEINLKAYKKDNSTLRIDFSDTGSGIEEKLLDEMFLDFVTTKASSEGTGLGLGISRKIISMHNGKIWAESAGKGKGATIHIELPIANDITEEEKQKFLNGQSEQKRRDMI